MDFARECQQRVEESLSLDEEPKEEKRFLLNMVKLISLKKSDHFKKALKKKNTYRFFFQYLHLKIF